MVLGLRTGAVKGWFRGGKLHPLGLMVQSEEVGLGPRRGGCAPGHYHHLGT